MCKFKFRLLIALVTFGIGVFISYKSYKTYQSQPAFQTPVVESINPSTQKETSDKADNNNAAPDNSLDLEKILTDKESISYKGFIISKQYLKRKFPNGNPVDVPFAVIKKGNKKIFEIDRDLEDYDREVRFGLFPVLGDENNKQLIIETTANRYWRYTIINLSPKFEVLFDSDDYPLTGGLEITDIDKDGKYELIQDLTTFFYFGISYRMGFASTSIIFEYNAKKRKYSFANHQFEDYLLKATGNESSIEDKIKRINELKANKTDSIGYHQEFFTAVMDVFLTYMYMGKEKEAWNYFEEYDLSDKEAVRAEIKKYLAEDSLYLYIKTLKL